MTGNTSAPSAIRWEMVLKRGQRHARIIAGLPQTSGRDGPAEYIIGDATSTLDLASQVFLEIYEKFLRGELVEDDAEPLTEAHVVNILKRAVTNRLVDLRRRIDDRKTDYAEEINRRSADDDKSFFGSYEVRKVAGLKSHQILSDPMPTPSEVEKSDEYRKQLERIYSQVKDDRELEELVRAICEKEGLRWPRDIARHLQTSVEDIYRRLKRLRRRFDYLRPRRRTKVV